MANDVARFRAAAKIRKFEKVLSDVNSARAAVLLPVLFGRRVNEAAIKQSFLSYLR